MIRLSDLTPDDVAREVTDWATAHLSSLAFAVGITDPIVAPGGSLAHEVRELVRYAQTGELDGSPAGRLQTVVDALYTTAHPSASMGLDAADAAGRGEPEHAIDVVIRAALARDALSHWRTAPVPVSWLAALAGLPVQTLRTYGARGELEVGGGKVGVSAARLWLSGRGVAGYGATK